MTDDEYKIPNDDSVSPADIQPGADLRDADLSDADLLGANLSDVTLREQILDHLDVAGARVDEATNLTTAELVERVDAERPAVEQGVDVRTMMSVGGW